MRPLHWRSAPALQNIPIRSEEIKKAPELKKAQKTFLESLNYTEIEQRLMRDLTEALYMHNKPMPDSAGSFSPYKQSTQPCPKCGNKTVRYCAWESSCGGYEDTKAECTTEGCNWMHWYEGSDS